MYFSEENAQRIDYIRMTIEKWHNAEKINDKEYYYLIASLLESVSNVANVAGVYGAFFKKWDPRAIKPMKFIPIELEKTEGKSSNFSKKGLVEIEFEKIIARADFKHIIIS